MTVLLAILAALLGLAFGSFLNVCISRLPQGESVVRPPSHCPGCGHPIRAVDNVPVVSWLALGGRCRDCKMRISARYPLVELAAGALFLLSFLTFGATFRGLEAAVFSFLLLGLAITDAETLLLPDALTLPGLALGVLFAAIDPRDAMGAPLETHHPHWNAGMAALLWAALAAGVLVGIRWLYWLLRRQEGLGLGDVKLIAMLAAWLGPWLGLLTFLLAVIAAAIYGITLAAMARLGRRKGPALQVPLGAFLGAAGICSIFRGGDILNWYLRFFRT